MNWEILKNKIYFRDGSWRDIYVKESSADDWEKWIDLVNKNYKINWYNGKTEKDESQIDFNVIKEYWNGNQDLISTAKVFLDNIQVNAHFFDDSEIENDIDPREFKSIQDHNKLLEYLKKVSAICAKPVFVTPENCPEIILMRIENDEVEIFTNSNQDE